MSFLAKKLAERLGFALGPKGRLRSETEQEPRPWVKNPSRANKKQDRSPANLLRRDWDSNPGYSRPYAAFRVRSIRPLWHLSNGLDCSNVAAKIVNNYELEITNCDFFCYNYNFLVYLRAVIYIQVNKRL